MALCAILFFLGCKSKVMHDDLINIENEYSSYDSFVKLHQYFESTDGRIAYIDKGEGPVILLMHGVPTSSWLYRKMIPQLVKGGYRVIVPDMLGFGGSDKPEGYDIYHEERMASRTLELMHYLGIENWSQVFHDGGGLWTWEMLKKNKKAITHLFMLNTIVYEEGFKPPIRFETGTIAGLFSRLYSSVAGQKIVIDQTIKRGVNEKKIISKNILEGYRKPFLEEGHGAIYYFFTQTCKRLEDYSELHKSLGIPTTVIWGENDVMLVWDKIKGQVKSNFKLEDEDIHVLDAKHFIQEEKPNEISEIILKALKG